MAQRTARIYKDTAGEWRWKLVGANGSDTIADSAESYHNRADALAGLVSACGQPGDRYRLQRDDSRDRIRGVKPQDAVHDGSPQDAVYDRPQDAPAAR